MNFILVKAGSKTSDLAADQGSSGWSTCSIRSASSRAAWVTAPTNVSARAVGSTRDFIAGLGWG